MPSQTASEPEEIQLENNIKFSTITNNVIDHW